MVSDKHADSFGLKKSELVLWAKRPTNDSDEMWMVLAASFLQAFLPHFPNSFSDPK